MATVRIHRQRLLNELTLLTNSMMLEVVAVEIKLQLEQHFCGTSLVQRDVHGFIRFLSTNLIQSLASLTMRQKRLEWMYILNG